MVDIRDEGIEILRVLCGSRAYGLEDDDSDFDYHGVFVIPTTRLLAVGLPKPKETQWLEGSREDDTAWELAHFLNLSLRCNPTILETYVAPVISDRPPCNDGGGCGEDGICDGDCGNVSWGKRLRDLLPAVISRKQIYDSFRGYAKNQRTKMFEPTGGVRAGERKGKFAMSYLRVLIHGIRLLTGGPAYWDIAIDGKDNAFLRAVKYGGISDGRIIDAAQRLESELTDAYLASKIQDTPQLNRVNDFLMEVRQTYWWYDKNGKVAYE